MTTSTTHTGPLQPRHRARVQEILASTRVFRSEEIDVAMELFDEAIEAIEHRTNGRSATDDRDASTAVPSSARGQTLRPGAPVVPAGSIDRHAARSAQHAAALLPSPSSSYVFLGAFTPDDELVGFACYGPTPGTDRTWDLYWIAVHPSAQGTGSGTILLSEVERRLEDTDARLFVVETSSRSEYRPTRSFYRARGYAEAARMRDFYAPSDDRIIFTKRFHHPTTGREQCHDE